MVKLKTVSLTRTVFYDEETGNMCQCSGDFYKGCLLRLRNDLPCKESIVRISPIDRNSEIARAEDVVRALDKSLDDMEHALRGIEERFKI